MEDLKNVRALGPEDDNQFLDYMIAQEQVQIELMELAINKQYNQIKPKIDQFFESFKNKNLG